MSGLNRNTRPRFPRPVRSIDRVAMGSRAPGLHGRVGMLPRGHAPLSAIPGFPSTLTSFGVLILSIRADPRSRR